jgi:hypothetical protein
VSKLTRLSEISETTGIKPWYAGLSGANITFTIMGFQPIDMVAATFRGFGFKSMRFGEVGSDLFCCTPEIHQAIEAQLKGEETKGYYVGGSILLDMGEGTLSCWFGDTWGEPVAESQEIVLGCLRVLNSVTYWKIESDGIGPTQRVEGADLGTLRERLGISIGA